MDSQARRRLAVARLLSSDTALADFLAGVRHTPALERERAAPVSREAIKQWQWTQKYVESMPAEPGPAPMVETVALAEQINFNHRQTQMAERMLGLN